MKRFIIFFLSILLSISIIDFKVQAKEPAPEVSADSAVLIDAATGTVLYSKNMDTAYPPASTTKVMTALLTLENTKLDDMVTVGAKVPFVDGSKIGLADGEQLAVKDLLYGLNLMSGNDCAEALAEHIGGSLENFAVMMNKRAKELGCSNTNFVNPHGLYNENHKISAKDLALIMSELSKHSDYREIASTYAYKIPPTNKHPEGIHLGNSNLLLNKNSKYYYQAAEAGKTGYTVQSLFSYVASASKNGQRLVVALVHDKNKNYYDDTKKLFEYGFNNFELAKLCSKGEIVETFAEDSLKVPLKASQDYFYVKEKNSTEVPKLTLSETSLKDKSFKVGDKIMTASIALSDKKLPSLQLESTVDNEIKSVFNSSAAASKGSSKAGIYVLVPLAVLAVLTLAAVFLKLKRRSPKYKSKYR
jgi:serine-type D-Ala-D-Ala carboxypeptidase (penicillin-binding protein 5/6)